MHTCCAHRRCSIVAGHLKLSIGVMPTSTPTSTPCFLNTQMVFLTASIFPPCPTCPHLHPDSTNVLLLWPKIPVSFGTKYRFPSSFHQDLLPVSNCAILRHCVPHAVCMGPCLKNHAYSKFMHKSYSYEGCCNTEDFIQHKRNRG